MLYETFSFFNKNKFNSWLVGMGITWINLQFLQSITLYFPNFLKVFPLCLTKFLISWNNVGYMKLLVYSTKTDLKLSYLLWTICFAALTIFSDCNPYLVARSSGFPDSAYFSTPILYVKTGCSLPISWEIPEPIPFLT